MQHGADDQTDERSCCKSVAGWDFYCAQRTPLPLDEDRNENGTHEQRQIHKTNQKNGIPTSQLKLASWPNITFILQGDAGDVSLPVSPSTYWQVDCPGPGLALPVFEGQPAGPNQSILGLPLMNNYYTVFDRSSSATGRIRFAPIKA